MDRYDLEPGDGLHEGFARVRELYPEAADQIGKSDGRAEALLVAHWGRRRGEQAALFGRAS